MTTIRLIFSAARYHATPWGRHVNEGVAEWPPSPYRLLRALYDVWQRKCADMGEEAVRQVLQALATEPPHFYLPAATASHTRSYLSANGKDPAEKNLVFDSFLVFDRPHACFARWPEVELSEVQRAVLERLLANLNFLGRSESWVTAECWDGPVDGPRWEPASLNEDQEELVAVACAASPQEFQGEGGDWMDALTYSTFKLLKDRASSPPLMKQVRYARPEGAILTNPPRKVEPKMSGVRVVVVSLDSTVLPLVTATMEIAEQARVRLMGAHKRVKGNDETKVSSLFSGKTADGQKRLDHGHLYILPLGNGKGRIDRILLYSNREDFTRDELDAVRGLRSLYQGDGRPEVQCVVTGQGGLDAGGRRLSRVAISATPFVPARHWRKGRDIQKFLRDEIRRECRNHGLGAEPVEVEILARMPGLFDAVEYRRNRKDDPVRPGYALRLTFSEEVRTPFSVGYGAHFGLGQFVAEG
jgi:CRISPR-associated protein Csb2